MRNRTNHDFLRMESIARITNIPIVNFGLQRAGRVYSSFKESNILFHWGLDSAEDKALVMINSLKPAAKIIEGPLSKLDVLMCKSLDFVEEHIPYYYFLPPQIIYWNTKEYVSGFAADRLDKYVEKCDKYVEKYLPEMQDTEDEIDSTVKPNDTDDTLDPSEETLAIQSLRKGRRFSKKLKRRLTQRTLAEMNALRSGGVEAVHIIFYGLELIISDPKLAFEKTKELWIYLSGPEPGNQERPKNLEEMTVMIMRETSRSIVHVINSTINILGKIPKRLKISAINFIHHLMYLIDSIIRFAHLESAKTKTLQRADRIINSIHETYDEVQTYTKSTLKKNEMSAPHKLYIETLYFSIRMLERLAVYLSVRLEAQNMANYPTSRSYVKRSIEPK